MNIKKSLKLSVTLEYILAFLTVSFVILYCNFLVIWCTYKTVSISNNKTNQYLKTTREEKVALIRLFNKPNHSSKLNLELQKISKAVENKSSLYQELNENDFPYLNKLFRRLNCLQATHNNIENISSNDLNKLNISNPMLLTFEQVDNELNNLIGQNILNQNIKCVKTMEK